MTSHRSIMVNAATAVRDSLDVKTAAVSAFGKGLLVIVGAYPGTEDESGIPGKDAAPFLWMFADGDNEEKAVDQTFRVRCVVAACVTDANGGCVISSTVTARTDSANGLIVNGGNKTVEDFRDTLIGVIRDAHAGAIVQRIRKTENDVSHYPLEWAEFDIEYMEPETLSASSPSSATATAGGNENN